MFGAVLSQSYVLILNSCTHYLAFLPSFRSVSWTQYPGLTLKDLRIAKRLAQVSENLPLSITLPCPRVPPPLSLPTILDQPLRRQNWTVQTTFLLNQRPMTHSPTYGYPKPPQIHPVASTPLPNTTPPAELEVQRT
jgi:hypothetical protein